MTLTTYKVTILFHKGRYNRKRIKKLLASLCLFNHKPLLVYLAQMTRTNTASKKVAKIWKSVTFCVILWLHETYRSGGQIPATTLFQAYKSIGNADKHRCFKELEEVKQVVLLLQLPCKLMATRHLQAVKQVVLLQIAANHRAPKRWCFTKKHHLT